MRADDHDRTTVRADPVDSVPDAVFHLDHDWQITFANTAAEQMMGRGSADMLGRSFQEAFPTGGVVAPHRSGPYQQTVAATRPGFGTVRL